MAPSSRDQPSARPPASKNAASDWAMMYGTLRSSVAEGLSFGAAQDPNNSLKAQHARCTIDQPSLSRVTLMTAPLPGIGEWYRHTGGDSFEVVAFDEDDGTI